MPDQVRCDACGEQYIDGKHADQPCGAKEWAIHQARLLGQIVYLLKQSAPAAKDKKASG